ncbi:MAG: hypothetical protein E7609_01375 [Ruminococcaceae bacterium]|nr:hypothetical protein [Oscillospiraceae bacterium]
MTGKKSGFDPAELRGKLLSKNAVTADGERLVSFSQGTPEYYANLTYAETVKDFIEEIRALFAWRMEGTANNILPVDSYFLFTKMQDELGMRTFMPEVGCQIPLMRQAVALARGTARAKGKTWGTYYECWRADRNEEGNIRYCMPCFTEDGFNEWYLTQDLHGNDDYTTHGENGGSSRLLQERLYFHTLMSGADYFGEEWGFRCSYYDTKDYVLTPYGKVKKEFIDTAAGIHGIEAKTPIALVLPLDYACVEIPETFDERCYIGTRRGKYMSVKLTEAESEYYGHIEDLLTLLFNRVPEEAFGNEGHVLANGRFGDVFDIVYEDATDEQLAKYDYLIDATADGRFAKANPAMAQKILSGADIGKLTNELDRVIPEVMPVYVDGLHWLVSTDDKGRRFLTVFNNEGNMRTSAKGDVINRACDKRVKITLKNGALEVFKNAREDIHLEKVDDKTYYATVSAADFVVFTF